jgi:hypothetical protein
MKKENKIPNIVYLAILTAITVVFWVFFSVYRIFSTQPAPSVAGEILEPLNPGISTEAIDSIETRIYFEEGELPQTIIAPPASESPSPSPTGTPIPSESPSPSPSPSSEESPSPTASPTATP